MHEPKIRQDRRDASIGEAVRRVDVQALGHDLSVEIRAAITDLIDKYVPIHITLDDGQQAELTDRQRSGLAHTILSWVELPPYLPTVFEEVLDRRRKQEF